MESNNMSCELNQSLLRSNRTLSLSCSGPTLERLTEASLLAAQSLLEAEACEQGQQAWLPDGECGALWRWALADLV